jgi:hypothetical protein
MRIVIFRSFRFFDKMFLQQKADVFALEMWMPLRKLLMLLVQQLNSTCMVQPMQYIFLSFFLVKIWLTNNYQLESKCRGHSSWLVLGPGI